MNISLTGKVAVVSGAASGIGLATAKALAEAGAAVMVGDIDPKCAQAAADQITAAGGRASCIQADVSSAEDVRRLMDGAVADFGSIDILVNNAGLQYIAPIHEYPEEKWHQLIGVMLTGTFLCTKYALPHMMARKWGRIVNIGSIHSKIASAYKSAYTSAKFGISGFTRVAALEAAAHGITVNCICPSYVRTPLVERQIAGLSQAHNIPNSEVEQKIMLADAAVKRLLEPHEVADLVVYLCGESAGGITGSDVVIDCGWTAH